MWVAGYPEPLPLFPPERGVNVLSLVSEKTMYSVSQSDQLDEALELAAPLNAGPAASAAAGAWAAIESLLYHPGDQADVKEGNLQRSEVITKALSTGTALALDSPSDVAAAERMKAVLGAPDPQLQNVSRITQGVFRRLYRQRNIVVHGGNTAAIALDPALRTAAPLIGAGLDRMAHAQLINQVGPLDLAARAENSLALVSDPLGPALTKLLE